MFRYLSTQRYIICTRTLELKISYPLSGTLISYGFEIFSLYMTELNLYKAQYFCMKLEKNFFIKNII